MFVGYWIRQQNLWRVSLPNTTEGKIMAYFDSVNFPFAAVMREMKTGNKIAAIKETRMSARVETPFGTTDAPGLKAAKDMVELWVAYDKLNNKQPLDTYDNEVLKQFSAKCKPGSFDLVGVKRP